MKKLEQIRQESKEIKDKIDNTEERLRQQACLLIYLLANLLWFQLP